MFRLSFSVIGQFSWLSKQFSKSWAARLSETQNKLSEEGPERILRISAFVEASRNLISKTFNKYSSHDTIPPGKQNRVESIHATFR
jgi:hypothetical protein